MPIKEIYPCKKAKIVAMIVTEIDLSLSEMPKKNEWASGLEYITAW